MKKAKAQAAFVSLRASWGGLSHQAMNPESDDALGASGGFSGSRMSEPRAAGSDAGTAEMPVGLQDVVEIRRDCHLIIGKITQPGPIAGDSISERWQNFTE